MPFLAIRPGLTSCGLSRNDGTILVTCRTSGRPVTVYFYYMLRPVWSFLLLCFKHHYSLCVCSALFNRKYKVRTCILSSTQLPPSPWNCFRNKSDHAYRVSRCPWQSHTNPNGNLLLLLNAIWIAHQLLFSTKTTAATVRTSQDPYYYASLKTASTSKILMQL
jgi:hypothetical protein